MRKIMVKLKDNVSLPWPMATKQWVYGYVEGYMLSGGGTPCAVILTDQGEFECLPLFELEVIPHA